MSLRPDPTLRALLQEMASHPSETGIVSDIDGTICPVAPSPDLASVPDAATHLLALLASRFSVVALLSGRCVSDMFRMVPLERLVMAGNHGMEWLCSGSHTDAGAAASYRPRLEEIAEELRDKVGPGVHLQPKGLSISFHYRLSEDPEEARRRVFSLLAPYVSGGQLRLQHGRLVVDLRPDCPLDKGTALEQIVRDHGLRYVIVFGDDLTDVSAFRKLKELRDSGRVRGVSVGVESGETDGEIARRADHLLADPDRVVSLLADLLDLVNRTRSSS